MQEMPLTINLATLAKHFSDEAKAYELVEAIRWPNGPICPHCGVVDEATYLEPRGEGRKTRSGKVMRRVIRAAWLGLDPGDLSALDDPASVDAIRAVHLGM